MKRRKQLCIVLAPIYYIYIYVDICIYCICIHIYIYIYTIKKTTKNNVRVPIQVKTVNLSMYFNRGNSSCSVNDT